MIAIGRMCSLSDTLNGKLAQPDLMAEAVKTVQNAASPALLKAGIFLIQSSAANSAARCSAIAAACASSDAARARPRVGGLLGAEALFSSRQALKVHLKGHEGDVERVSEKMVVLARVIPVLHAQMGALQGNPGEGKGGASETSPY